MKEEKLFIHTTGGYFTSGIRQLLRKVTGSCHIRKILSLCGSSIYVHFDNASAKMDWRVLK